MYIYDRHTGRGRHTVDPQFRARPCAANYQLAHCQCRVSLPHHFTSLPVWPARPSAVIQTVASPGGSRRTYSFNATLRYYAVGRATVGLLHPHARRSGLSRDHQLIAPINKKIGIFRAVNTSRIDTAPWCSVNTSLVETPIEELEYSPDRSNHNTYM